MNNPSFLHYGWSNGLLPDDSRSEFPAPWQAEKVFPRPGIVTNSDWSKAWTK